MQGKLLVEDKKTITLKCLNGEVCYLILDKCKYPQLRDYKNLNKNTLPNEDCFFDMIEKIKENYNYWYKTYFKNDNHLLMEFYKVIYDYIKFEVVYTKESSLFKLVETNPNLKRKYIRELINKDLEDINKRTYINPTLLDYLNNCLNINDVLSKEVIKAIIMCNDYNLIRKGNRYILKKQKELIQEQISKNKNTYRNIMNNIDHINMYYREIVNKRLCISFLSVLMVIFSSSGLVFGHAAIKTSKKVMTYKTTHEIYSSLGTKEEHTEYESLLEDASYITVYNEPYLIDNVLYRDVDTYNINDFETLDELNKLYEIDFDLLKYEPVKIETIEVSENDIQECYKIIEKIRQDSTDTKEQTEELSFSKKMVYYFTGIILITLLLAIGALGIALIQEKIKGLKINKDYLKQFLSEFKINREDYRYYLNKLNLTLTDAIKLCDEIVGLEEIETLDDKYKQIIEEYKILRNQYGDLETNITNIDNDKLVKKYKRKGML